MVLQSLRDMIGFCVRPVHYRKLAGLGGRPPRLPLGEPADYAVSARPAGRGQLGSGGAGADTRARCAARAPGTGSSGRVG